MVMGSLPEEFDIAIIGAGVGGYVAAIRAAELKKNVVLIEKEKLGGHCLNYACIPSKTLIHIADIFYSSQHSEKFGLASKATIDAKKMYDWRMAVSKKLEDGVSFLCKSNGVEVLKGNAVFTSSNTLLVDGLTTIKFKKAIIATGSVPTQVKGFEVDDKFIIDYKKALMLDYIPKSLLIIGAGYVAVEIGILYAKLGTKVTILARSDILSHFDREAVSIIKKRMLNIGINIITNVTPISRNSNEVTLSNGDKISADLILVAIGLSPFTEGLRLESTSVKKNDKGFIIVDERLQTTDPNIFAIGDVIGEPLLAHKAIRQGVIAAEVASGLNSAYDNIVVPAVIFSDPEIAIAGSVEEKEGIKIKKFPLSALGRGIALDEVTGFVKIAYEENGIIKGVEIVSPDANAMIAEVVLAIELGATVEDIASTIHPHPTFSEAIQESAEAAIGAPIHYFYGNL
ncbi:MAG: dihydrolipoyl dehydrogenase [Candidatus Micrarchaeia archaeon]